MQVVQDQSKKTLVLHSGGLDSTVVLWLAIRDFGKENVWSFTIDYGQRHIVELERATRICREYDIHRDILKITDMPKVMLTDEDAPVPNMSYAEIQGVSPTYVPFRNGLLLARVASHADAHAFGHIYMGPHAEDAANWAYPDCTMEFMGAMANAIFIGTYGRVRLHTPLLWSQKHEIVELGKRLGAPLEVTWSCYVGGSKHCGVCPTCRARKDAFSLAGVKDQTEYEE